MKNIIYYLFLTLGTFTFAQLSIKGFVTDQNDAPLPGATVISSDGASAITNFNGVFFLDASSDEVSIEISYLGFESTTISATKQTKDLGVIKLELSSNDLQEVIVKATYLPSQVRALNIQKNAVNVKNVIASDAIGKLPDRNAAEAVQRIQGVSIERDHGEGRYVIVRGTPIKWNSNLLNGTRLPASEGTSNNTGGDRAVPLDIFPSEMIQYVELSKALTPDMEGDAIGGSVNFITKTAPSKRTINISAANGYNAQAQDGTQNYSVFVGDKIGKFGYVASATLWDRAWATDNYEVAYNSNLSGDQQYSVAEFELRDYIGNRSTVGYNVGLEYDVEENSTIYARAIHSTFEDNESAREHLFELPEAGSTEGTMTVRTREGITQIKLQGIEFGGDHKLNEKLNFSWRYSDYKNEMRNNFLPTQNDPSQRGYLLAWFDQDVQFSGLASDGYKYLDVDAPAGYIGDNKDNIQPGVSSGAFNANTAYLAALYNYQQNSFEQDLTGQFDVSYKLNNDIRIKFGSKLKSKEKRGGSPLIYSIPAAFFGVPGARLAFMSEFETEAFPSNGGFLSELGQNYDGLIQDNITLGVVNSMFTDEVKNSIGFIDIVQDDSNPDSAPSFYSGTEDVFAAYAMAEISLNENLEFLVGFRNELTTLTYNGNQVDENENITEIRKEGTNAAFLPMLHVKYSPNNKLNVKAAITRSFARPDFADLNPGAVVDDINRVISRGNPGLKNSFSTNYDLMGEYYFDNVGVFSAGVFHKSISNDIFSATSRVNGYTIVQPENAENGSITGAEIGISKRFGSTGFGVDANYTYTDSKVDVPLYSVDGEQVTKTVVEQKIPGQADHIYNASVFYEKNGLLVRVASNYKGDYIEIYSNDGPNHNRWYGKNLTVDFSATYAINDRIRIFAELNNLTNEPLYYYHGTNENRPEQVEFYDIRGQVGLRFNLF